MEKYTIYEVTVIKLFIIKWHAKIHSTTKMCFWSLNPWSVVLQRYMSSEPVT